MKKINNNLTAKELEELMEKDPMAFEEYIELFLAESEKTYQKNKLDVGVFKKLIAHAESNDYFNNMSCSPAVSGGDGMYGDCI